MSTTFLLVKFFKNEEYATEFVNGNVFCNTLGTFKKIEAADDCGRADRDEGTTAWLQPGQVDLVLNDVDISGDLAGPSQVQMHWLDDVHLFCMHACHSGNLDLSTLTNANIEDLRSELIIPTSCLTLGKHAVVVCDVPSFVEKIRVAAEAEKYKMVRGLVRYYDPESFHGEFNQAESMFRKQERYRHQREFRFAINTGSSGDSPLRLHIGDISDITVRLYANELNGPKLLGGRLSLNRS